ncbi:MAG: hypothetical protein WCT77_08080 [Bacteroidota bacterium]
MKLHLIRFLGIILSCFLILNCSGKNKINKILQELESPNSFIRGGAVWAASCLDSSSLQDPRIIEGIIKCALDSENSVRRTTIGELYKFKDKRISNILLSALKIPEFRTEAISSLCEMKDEKGLIPLLMLMNDTTEGVQQKLIEGLPKYGSVAVKPLIERMDTKDLPTWLKIAEMLWVINDTNSIIAIKKPLIDKDLKFIKKTYYFFITIGLNESRNVLKKTLYKYGDKQMAFDFCTSGDSILNSTAREWAWSKGYILTIIGGSNDSWGSKKVNSKKLN